MSQALSVLLISTFRCRPLRYFHDGRNPFLFVRQGLRPRLAPHTSPFTVLGFRPRRPWLPKVTLTSGTPQDYPRNVEASLSFLGLSFSGLNTRLRTRCLRFMPPFRCTPDFSEFPMLRLGKARFRWRGCTPFRPGFGPDWDSDEAFPP